MHQSLSRTTLTVVLLLVCLQGFAHATIRSIPSPYSDFEQAYNASQSGDTIQFMIGVYENVSYPVNLTLQGLTILGEELNSTILRYDSYFWVESPDTVFLIKNLTFETGGVSSIEIFNGCRVESCVFRNGHDLAYGRIRALSNYVVRNCEVYDNTSQTGGGTAGIDAAAGGTVKIIEHNWIHDNVSYAGGAIRVVANPGPVIRHNVFSNNTATDGGGAIYFVDRTCELVNNTFVGNNAPVGSAFRFNWNNSSDLGPFHNNIIANNTGGPAIYNGANPCFFGECNAYWPDVSNLVATHSGNCSNPEGVNDCIVTDPLFCNAPTGDFSLDSLSPCLTSAECEQIGALGAGCNDLEYISTPSITGPSSGQPGASLEFTANDAVSSEGHTLQYQYNWDFHQGPNDPSPWSTDSIVANQYPLVGVYNITVHARCQQHPDRVSYWSEPHSVLISSTHGSIIGIIRETEDYLPIENALVRALIGCVEIASDVTNASGEYTLSPLTPGSYDIEASADGYESCTEFDVYVTAGETSINNNSLDPLGEFDSGFRPYPDGWQFDNFWSDMWPYFWNPGDPVDEQCNCALSRCFPTWALFRDAFGASQTEFENGLRRPAAEDEWNSIKVCWAGSCFGFAVSSLLFFDEILQVDSVFPGFCKTYGVPLGDDSRWLVNKYMLYQYGRESKQRTRLMWSTEPRETLDECKAMLSSSNRNDRALLLHSGSGTGHAVVPYRCEQDQTNSSVWYIHVWDVNTPGSGSIVIDRALNAWAYDACPGFNGPMYLALSSEQLSTFPTLRGSGRPDGRWTSVGTRNYSDYIDIYIATADSVHLQSAAGEIGHFGDSLFSTLTDGIPIVPITGQETSLIGYSLPNADWIAHISGLSETTFRLALSTESTMLVYERFGVGFAETEEVVYAGNDSTLWIHNPSISTRAHDFRVIAIAADSEIVCQVRDLQMSPYDSVRYSMTDVSGLQIDNYGQPTTYTVRVQITGETADTVFYHAGVAMGSSTSHSLIPDWRQHNDSLIVFVDSGMTGEFTDTLQLINEEEPPHYICGDIDGSGSATVDISDLVYLVDYMFNGGPEPPVIQAADVDGSGGGIDIADLVYLVDYMFNGGPEPTCGQ